MHSFEVAGYVLLLDLPCHLHLDRLNTTKGDGRDGG